LAAVFLPIVLALALVGQNTAFNEWLHIAPETYFRLYASSFALGMLIYGPAAFLRKRWRYAYLITISALVSVILIAEYLFFSYSGGFLQISSLKMAGDSGAAIGTAIRLVKPRLILFLGNLFLALSAAILAYRAKSVTAVLTIGEAAAVGLLVLASVFGGYTTLLAAEKREWGNDSRLYSQMYDLNGVVGKMGVVNYFLEDAVKRALASGKVTAADKAFVKEWAAARPAPAAAGKYFGAAKGRNLIFIQVESLENAVVNAKIGGAEITPNLNALAKDGLYFSDYYAQVGMGNTADAEFSTLNSLYPLPDSVAFVSDAQNKYSALPKFLDANGYRTFVFHGDAPTFWNRANIYPNLGYQTLFMEDAYTSARKIGITGLGDEDFFKQTVPKIEALPQPFMATLITLSSHTPFILPNDLRTLAIPSASGLNDTQTQYLQSLHYADAALGEFIDRLKQSDIYGDSVIVIFGDHGSHTGISNALGTETDGIGDLNGNRVPLIILAPGTGLAGEKTTPGSHIDVYPTVADLLGLAPPRSVLGQDLLKTASPVVVDRKSGTGGISAILGGKVDYAASADGDFANGSCLTADTRQPVPLKECQALYDEQSATLRVSDAVVRGNLIDDLAGK
jgi:lipoteichoic acid synthase